MNNVFWKIPDKIEKEIFEELFECEDLRIERILSQGQSSPDSGWYDQEENEWVLVLQGAGNITFEDGHVVQLKRGGYLYIPSHTKHRVSWTDPDETTVWLAIFYKIKDTDTLM